MHWWDGNAPCCSCGDNSEAEEKAKRFKGWRVRAIILDARGAPYESQLWIRLDRAREHADWLAKGDYSEIRVMRVYRKDRAANA